ncbi:hypothetical protein HJ526_02785 [Donghicola sp. C2-DW-16]|uniref:Flagellar hook-length control protein-like C-terminal domain-containing protein n=1 Tax=Donghicola mangrovi TaxID=2729614 RepID=A0ABX2PA35_9RHOB|nr:flagellar hook-length control protein FliK [Donghicola mangrovi]NVO26334.1 hypothetical protein [Donghicola mangrovi]
MTPLTLAEQSFLKLDAPQQAKPAASQGASGAGFGNIMSEARENAEAAPEAVVIDAAPEAAADTPEQTADAEIIQLPTKPAAKGEAVQANAATTDLPDLPVIARLPEGGLTTKANPDTAPRKTAEVAKVQPAKEPGLDPAANALPVTGTVSDTAVAETAKPVQAQTLKLVQAKATPTDAPAEVQETTDLPEVVTLVMQNTTDLPNADPTESTAKPATMETMQALTASTSAPALVAGTQTTLSNQEFSSEGSALINNSVKAKNPQSELVAAQAPVTDAKAELPATTHTSLALRAQMGKKAAPATVQTAQQAPAQQTAKPVKAEATTEGAQTFEVAKTETGETPTEVPVNLETTEQVAPEAQPQATAETAPQTPEQLAAAASVAAPIVVQQADNAPAQNRSERTVDKTAQQITTAPKGPQAQAVQTQNTEATAQAEPTQRRTAPEAKQSVAAQSFEQMIQQAVSDDAPLDLSDLKLASADSAPAPQTQSTLPQSAPQVQVATSPEAFQPQLESAARDIATRELSMEQADWPETMVQDIGFETLADGEAIDIQLTPEHMGRVQLRMEMRDGAASITIVTETAEAAKQFNDNQQKLADLLAKQGVELANHNASAGRDFGRQDQGGRNGGEGTAGNSQTQATGGTGQTEARAARKDPNRLVDVQA